MAQLTTKKRKALPTKVFALPNQRKYPLNDLHHAYNAKSRAAQQLAAGGITHAQYAEITRKANKKIMEAKRVKPTK